MYITFYQKEPKTQIPDTIPENMDLDQLLTYLNAQPIAEEPAFNPEPLRHKITICQEDGLPTKRMLNKLLTNERYLMKLPVISMPENMDPKDYYHVFRIPKKSNPKKFRILADPHPDLKAQQRRFLDHLQYTTRLLAHEAAHAYVTGRSNITQAKVHQKNESRWSLKLDIKDFFPSFTKDNIMTCLERIYPLHYLLKNPEYRTTFENNIDYCLHEGHLPQGTPISPFLTNIMMIPIDETLRKTLIDYKGKNFKYTRYADDMEISCKYKFNPSEIAALVADTLKLYIPALELNWTKSKFQSTSGRNWSLGIMRNKDNNLTVGHKNNQKFRAAIFQFMMGQNRTIESAYHLQGLIAYYHAIQPEYTDYVLEKYSKKFAMDVKDTIKATLR